jgi:hypothetical protein
MVQIKDHPLYGRHDIESAMSYFWKFYKSRFLVLFITSFIMGIGIQYATSYYINFNELKSISDPAALIEKLRESIVPIILISLAGLVFNNILHYYILYNPLDKAKNIFVSAVYSLKYYIPYLIILVILAFFGSFIIALGLVALVVGVFFSVIYLMMIYLFIMPVMMAEGIHIGHTITRTLKLAYRNFWTNIGWTSVFLILLLVVSVIISGILMLPFTGSFLKTIANPGDSSAAIDMAKSPLYIVLSGIANALTMPALPIFGFIIYFNGRAREEVVEPPVYGDKDYKVTVEDLYAKPLEEKKEEKE